MALEIETTLPTGVVANYVRIRQIIADYSDGATARVEIALYANHQARANGYDPLRCDVYDLGEIGAMEERDDDFRGVFYDALLTLPEFEGAKSV
jgi:hypothetical protein